jgi:predicted TIM-barrel fold metal-dependent hydrolase
MHEKSDERTLMSNVPNDAIVDAHVYCLPRRLRTPFPELKPDNAAISRAIYRHPEALSALELSSSSAILASMNSAGIARSLIVSFPWISPELCSENNRAVLDACRADDRLSPICSVQPLAPGWEAEAELCRAGGAVGIKVNARWQGFELDCDAMQRVARWAGRNGLFVMVHVDQAYRKSPASAAHLLQLAEANPQTQFLAAHLGGMLGLYAPFHGMAERLGNIWFDTAVSATLYMVRFYVECGLGNRLVFGSDFPFNHCHDQGQVVSGLRLLGLTPEQQHAIFCRNLGSLLRSARQTGS